MIKIRGFFCNVSLCDNVKRLLVKLVLLMTFLIAFMMRISKLARETNA